MTETRTVSRTRRGRTRLLLGGLVVVLGVLLLADTTGVLDVDGFDVFLASALVLYGGYRLVTERARHLFWPGVFLLVGGGWLLVEFGVRTGTEVRQFWPLLVVLFGLSVLRSRGRSSWGSNTVVVDSGDGVRETRGITAVFEDARLDLRGIEHPPQGFVEATAVFGDVDVVVPEDWVVVLETTAVFGGVRDDRRSRPSGEPDLVVGGVAVFGDVRLTD